MRGVKKFLSASVTWRLSVEVDDVCFMSLFFFERFPSSYSATAVRSGETLAESVAFSFYLSVCGRGLTVSSFSYSHCFFLSLAVGRSAYLTSLAAYFLARLGDEPSAGTFPSSFLF